MTTVGMNTYKKAYPVGYPTKSQDLFILFFFFFFFLILFYFLHFSWSQSRMSKAEFTCKTLALDITK